ncbi:MAG: tetratricopeptide repeat protein [Acidobacteria bacterium]|nr:tetratricopeptide repeat protein [Acidobacteriota bacterium]
MRILWWRRREAARPRSLYGNLIAYMKGCLATQPANDSLRLALVSHLKEAGRYDEAIRELQFLLQRDPGHRKAKSLLLRLKLEQRLAAINRNGS